MSDAKRQCLQAMETGTMNKPTTTRMYWSSSFMRAAYAGGASAPHMESPGSVCAKNALGMMSMVAPLRRTSTSTGGA